jgi:hypothetical protein
MKKETLEEVAERYVDCFEFGIAHPRRVAKNAFINGAKWQQEQNKKMYSEEEVKQILLKTHRFNSEFLDISLEQFKKK